METKVRTGATRPIHLSTVPLLNQPLLMRIDPYFELKHPGSKNDFHYLRQAAAFPFAISP